MGDAEVDVEFAHKRLGIVQDFCSVRKTLLRLLRGPRAALDATLAGTPTDAGHLVRPPGGFGVVYGTVADVLRRRGVSVLTGCDLRSIRRGGGGFEVDLAGSARHYDRVISTIPIPTLARLIGLPLGHPFEYMKLVSLFYRHRGEIGHDSSFLFNFSPEGRWKRVVTLSRFYGRHGADDYLVVEATLRPGDDVDVAGLRRDFEGHARKAGLFRGELNYQGCLTTNNAYPIYRRDNIERMREAKKGVAGWGVCLAGRQGEFDYISSSDAAGNARAVATRLKGEYEGACCASPPAQGQEALS
jgi:protoporphyrinogen oxidase